MSQDRGARPPSWVNVERFDIEARRVSPQVSPFAQALHDPLGLQHRSAQGTVDVLRIDRIQRPAPD